MSIILALFNGCLWALLDLLRKKSLEYLNEFTIAFILVFSQLILFSILLFFSSSIIMSVNYFYYYFPLILLNAISLIIFLKAIKMEDISLSIPILSFTPLFAAVYAYFVLDEKLHFLEFIGIISILIGVIFLYSQKMNLKCLLNSPIRIINNYSARYMIITSLIWSLTPVLDKKGLQYTDIYFHGFLQSLGTIFLLTIFFYNKKIKLSSHVKLPIVLMATLISIGFIAVFIQFLALNYNNVALLEATKRALGIILAVLFGYIFFKEAVTQQKVIGVILMIFGIFSMYGIIS